MKDYELHARRYPVIVAMLIPVAYTTWLLIEYFPQLISIGNMVITAIAYFVPIAIVVELLVSLYAHYSMMYQN